MEKNLWRCHNSINWAIIWQWSRFGGNGWREFSSDSKTEFGAVLHSSLTPEKYWLFVSLQFVYILCLFCPDFVFLMVCKRRSYFAMVPVKEVDCISPPPLHLVPLPSFIKMLEVFIHSLVMDFTHVCILNTRKHIQVCFHIRW